MFLSFLFKWPIKDALETATCLLAAYAVRRCFRQSFLKYATRLEDRLAALEDKGPDLDLQVHKQKVKLFKLLRALHDKYLPSSDSRKGLNILEIGMGCGNNFQYYPPNTNVTGLDPNGYCEAHAWERLRSVNERLRAEGADEVKLKDFLVGYAENMSYIRPNTVEVVVCTYTLSFVEDVDQTLDEIHRILKPNGLLVVMDRAKSENRYWSVVESFISPYFYVLTGQHLSRDLVQAISRSKFGTGTKSVIQTSFENSLKLKHFYGIAVK